MATLTNTKIKDTYDGLLKTTTNEAIAASGVTLIEDGLGNASALSVGRANNGVTITGNLAVDTNTLYVDAANNRVGVGISNPATLLHIQSNSAPTLRIDHTEKATWGVGDVIGKVDFYTSDASGNAPYSTAFIQSENETGAGTLPSGALVFGTATYNAVGGAVERMRIDSSGRVGIGTSSPTAPLQVERSSSGWTTYIKNTSATSPSGLLLSGGDSSANFAMYVRNAAETSDLFAIKGNGNVGIGTSSPNSYDVPNLVVEGSTLAGITISESTGGGTGAISFGATAAFDSKARISCDIGLGELFFSTQGSEAMRIDSSGNVGIGESNPEQFSFAGKELHIYGGSGVNQGAIVSIASSQSANRFLGALTFVNGSATNEFQRRVGQIGIDADSGGADTSRMTFFTKGGVGDFAERMRITSLGDVLIGTTGSPDGTTNYGAGFIAQSNERKQLRLASNTTGGLDLAQFYNPNGKVGSILTNGSATSFVTSSDYRLKENVVEMTGALDRVDALKPSRFNFIADPEKTVDGFLAHEVQDIVPEAVTGEKDAVDEEGNPIYQGIDQSKLTPLLTAALKEAHALIKSLEARIEILENK